jgi:hypothetical protein
VDFREKVLTVDGEQLKVQQFLQLAIFKWWAHS